MSLKKITLASLILFSLTACSSGGSSSPNNDVLQAELAKTKNQLATSEQLLNSTKTELAQAQTDLNTATSNLQKAQTELAKVQADSKATAQELTTAKANLAKAENAKVTAEQALAAANSEKKAVETELNSAKSALSQAQTDLNTATSNLQKSQTELAKVQADNKATAQELTTAKANLTQAEQAKQNAETALENKTDVITEIVRKAAAATQAQGNEYSWINYRGLTLPQGLSKHPYISMSDEKLDGIFVGDHYIYLTPDVMLIARDNTAFWSDEIAKQDFFRVQSVNGEQTAELPKTGVATYIGHGFNADNVGTLNYQVDFANKTGSGSVSNFNNANIPTIQLTEGKILSGQIKADATAGDAVGRYELGFYGQNARTIAGEVYISKQFEGGIETNSGTRNKYNDTQRGTHFGIVGEKQ